MINYTRNNSTITGKLHDELVMMDIDKGKYFAFNEVATRIWEILEKPKTEDELVTQLLEEYEVEEEQCRAEVKELLGELGKLGLVEMIGKG